jgi:hypothetical protein
MVADEDLWRYFAPDYVTARQRFLDGCEKADAELTTLTLSVRGPSDERLSIDVAYLGPENPRRLLIHTSGVHGVEGFPGSAVQVRILERWAEGELEIPAGCGLLVAHSINPYGFAWLRRVNEDNADLNRNFLPPGEAYVGEPERYHELDQLLNPRSHKSAFDFFALKAAWVMYRMGFNVAKQAIAEGQYERPKAMQFGGSKLCEGPKLWLDHLSRVLPKCGRAVWLDFHTGLGPFGVDSLLISNEEGDEAFASLAARYGETVQSLDPDAGVAYRIRGGMLAGVSVRWPGVDWTLITQEFGTLKLVAVLEALRAENRMTQWSGIEERKKLNAVERKRLVEVFSPNSVKWQGMIMARGQALVDDAFADLAAWPDN